MSEEKRDYAADLAALKSIPNFQVKLYSGLGYCLFTEKGIYHKYLSEELADFIALAHTILPWYIRKTRELEAELAEAEAKMEAWEKLCVGYMAERDAAEGREGALRELMGDILPGAMFASCNHKNHEQADPTFHCCDWSEAVEKIQKALSIPAPVNLEAMRRVVEAAKAVETAYMDTRGDNFNILAHAALNIAHNKLHEALADLEGGESHE